MSDTEGSLPASGAHDLRNAGAEPETARLPPKADSRPGGQIPPSAPGGPPLPGGRAPAAPAGRTEPPADATAAPPPSREERIAAATRIGGLTVLPAGFGDADGDWVTVWSENPFEVLYLDDCQAERITTEIVSRHRDLLQKFWRDKIKNLTQGAARLSILNKYGGEHRAEALVRSYPDSIDNAYHRLSTRSGIEETYHEIITRQQNAFFVRLDEKLKDFMIDGELQPQEIAALFEFADRGDVAREIVAARVQERIRAAGLVSDREVSGTTLEQQLRSSCWVHPSRIVPPTPAPAAETPGIAPLLVFSLVVVLALLIGAALVAYRMRSDSPEGSVIPSVPTPAVTGVQTAQDLPEKSDQVASAAPEEPRPAIREPIEESAAPAAKAEPPLPATVPPPVEKPLTVSAEDLRTARQELDDIRALSTIDPDAALERMSRLDSTLREHPREFAEERIELADLRAQIRTAAMEGRLAEESRIRQEEAAKIEQERNEQWEKRLAQIESLSKQGNHSAAKNLADELLSEPGVPEPIATRARKLAEEAVEKLQEAFSKAKVKSKTNRSPDPPR